MAVMEARWVLNIVFLPETDSYSQTPDGNFASSGKMLFIVAYISHANGTRAKSMMFYYSVWKQMDETGTLLFSKLYTRYRNHYGQVKTSVPP